MPRRHRARWAQIRRICLSAPVMAVSGGAGEAGKGRQTAPALGVVLVGDVLAPAGLGPLVAGDGFDDGRAGHEVARCGAVPRPFAGRGTEDVAGADVLDPAAAGLAGAVAVRDAREPAAGGS